MSVKRKLYKSEFRAKVALVAVRGDETSAQLFSKFGVHSAMVNSWRRILASIPSACLIMQARMIVGRRRRLQWMGCTGRLGNSR